MREKPSLKCSSPTGAIGPFADINLCSILPSGLSETGHSSIEQGTMNRAFRMRCLQRLLEYCIPPSLEVTCVSVADVEVK